MDWRHLAAVIVISLLVSIVTLLLIWGWWDLGRPFSLSPLKVANAFYADPSTAAWAIFAASNGNAKGDELVKLPWSSEGGAGYADSTVWYGFVGGTNRLGMGLADGSGVRRSQAGGVL